MRLGRVRFGDEAQPALAHKGYWLRAWARELGLGRVDPTDLLQRRQELQEAVEGADVEAMAETGDAVSDDDAILAQPLTGPRTVVGVGLNYREHADEVLWEAPKTPLLFAKWSSSVTGPYDPIPFDASISAQVDHEVELAAVIGRPALDVSTDEALAYVAGYAVANDVSARDLQFSESQWTRSKSFDGFCPLGPWITTADEVPDPQALQLSCHVNGIRRQYASTSQMIHGVADLIAFASRGTTLQPGDLILTGTPSGVGVAMDPRTFLARGDTVRIEISGLGAIEHTLR